MPNPDFRSESGADQSGTASATITFTGLTWQANDIIVVCVATDGYVPTLSTANGFVIATDPQGNAASVTTNGGTPGAAECGLFIFWKRAVGSTTASDPEPVIAAPTGGGTCWCLETNSYLGARTSGTPWHIITTAVVGTATSTVAPPAVTPTLNNCLVMPCAASSNDDQAFNAWTVTGAASPAGQIDTGWHTASGNACAFTGGRGGFATAGGSRSGSTTFGATTKQAQITLVMASLPEVPTLPSWTPVAPASTARGSLSAAAMMAALASPVAPPPASPAPPLSWAPEFPDYPLRVARSVVNVGGQTAPDATIPNASAPPLSWAPEFPDVVSRARSVVNVGGATAPVATIPNPPSPPLAWAPEFPDVVSRARGAVIVGGAAAPEATIPNSLPPGMPWTPVLPDLMPPVRYPQQGGMAAPPFAGGQRLTVGAMAVRQNILSALAFSTPLTTFGTDITFTAAAGTVLTSAGHNMVNCAGPFTVITTGTLPGGLTAGTLYYCAQPPDNNTYHLATSAANADAGTFVTMTNGGSGTHTLVRTTNSAPLYSTFVSVIERGTQSSSPNLPTDKFGNAYSYVSGFPIFFASFPNSAVSVAIKIGGIGGNLHTWSTSIGNIGGQQDEVLASGLEIFDAHILQDSSVVERPDGGAAIITSNPVTTTARALLVAIINGNSNVGQENFWIFFDGFTKQPYISAEGDPSPSGYDQVCVATRYVDIKGTYTFRAQGTVRSGGGPSGGIMTLLAFQAVSSDLSPLDWLYQQADPPHVHRRGQAAGETAPPSQLGTSVPALSWSPGADRALVSRARAAPGGETAPPPAQVAANLVSWLPGVVQVAGARSIAAQAGGATTPLVDTNAGPAPWLSAVTDRPRLAGQAAPGGETAPPPAQVAANLVSWIGGLADAFRSRPLVAGGETAPVFVSSAPPAPPLSWSPVFPDAPRLPRATVIQGGASAPEATLPNTPSPPLAWSPVFPDRVARARGSVIQGGQAAPEATLPNPPAPPLSWFPVFPDAPHRLRLEVSVLTSGQAAPVFVPAVPPAPSWLPVVVDFALRPRETNPGAEVGPVAAIPNPPAPPLSWSPAGSGPSPARAAAVVATEWSASPVVVAPNPPPRPLVPMAGRGPAGVSRGTVTRTGGVSRTGGVRVALPSPSGEWSPQWKDNVVDFDRDQFTRFIDDKGYSVIWEKAVFCPNVPGSGLSPRDHAIGCPICGGSGFVYVDAIPTRMLMQGIKLSQSFFAHGRWDMGNMLVTAEPEFTIDYFDRLTLLNGVGRFTQRVVRQPGTATDRLKYAPLCFHYVAWVDRTGALVPLVQDVDFRISSDGASVEWSAATQPDAGSVYTVCYDYRPRYVVLDLVHHHRDSTVEGQHYQFPVQAMAKLDYLIRNEGADAPQVVDKSPFQ